MVCWILRASWRSDTVHRRSRGRRRPERHPRRLLQQMIPAAPNFNTVNFGAVCGAGVSGLTSLSQCSHFLYNSIKLSLLEDITSKQLFHFLVAGYEKVMSNERVTVEIKSQPPIDIGDISQRDGETEDDGKNNKQKGGLIYQFTE